MRRAVLVTVLICGGLGIQPAAADLFFDNFNRADGPLTAPWEPLASLLYIQGQRVVAQANTYGEMIYREPCGECYSAEASVAADFGFSSSTDYGGHFRFFIGGGSQEEGHYWGFIAKIGLSAVAIYSYDETSGEQEIVSVTSPLEYVYAYRMTLAYDPLAQTIALTIVEDGGPTVLALSEPRASEPFCYCIIVIDNMEVIGDQGWLDDVAFAYSCDPTAAPPATPALALRAWPSPFTRFVELRALAADPGARAAIFDVAGRQVAELPLREGGARWDAGDLPAGAYFARLAGQPDGQAVKLLKLP